MELAHERDENARRAVLTERVRIARELHDVVAHHVSVMGVQAGAGRMVLDTDPAQARAALTGIEAAARGALDEMHRLLGVLRDPDAVPAAGAAPEQPPPGLGDVPDVLDAARRAGLRVDFAEVGDPAPLPESVGLSAYRIVQEAVTNTLRHAAATRVDVRVRHLAGARGRRGRGRGGLGRRPGARPRPGARAGGRGHGRPRGRHRRRGGAGPRRQRRRRPRARSRRRGAPARGAARVPTELRDLVAAAAATAAVQERLAAASMAPEQARQILANASSTPRSSACSSHRGPTPTSRWPRAPPSGSCSS